jgi:tryptophan synthase alpha chain
MVSSASITGAKSGITDAQIDYFERTRDLNLKSPRLIGFGISDKYTFETACSFANGAIIGSAFIKALNNHENIEETVNNFVKGILN